MTLLADSWRENLKFKMRSDLERINAFMGLHKVVSLKMLNIVAAV